MASTTSLILAPYLFLMRLTSSSGSWVSASERCGVMGALKGVPGAWNGSGIAEPSSARLAPADRHLDGAGQQPGQRQRPLHEVQRPADCHRQPRCAARGLLDLVGVELRRLGVMVHSCESISALVTPSTLA